MAERGQMRLMLICNDAGTAQAAVGAGVDCIFVDLERAGKLARQAHRNSHISDHVIEDVSRIRSAVPDTMLLVRLDPWGSLGFEVQLEEVLARGADVLMLPMIQCASEVAGLCDRVDGRAKVMPLIETIASANEVGEIAAIGGVSDVFIGLNDLHLEMRRTFMFELLCDGTVERLGRRVQEQGKDFGFGGIARIGRGALPAESILAEHYRIGSRAVILSRQFRVTAGLDFSWEFEVARIRETERRLARRTECEMTADCLFVCERVEEIVIQARTREAGGA